MFNVAYSQVGLQSETACFISWQGYIRRKFCLTFVQKPLKMNNPKTALFKTLVLLTHGPSDIAKLYYYIKYHLHTQFVTRHLYIHYSDTSILTYLG